MHWRRKWQPTPVFLPGESQGRGSLVGCRLRVAQSWTRLTRLSSSSSSGYSLCLGEGRREETSHKEGMCRFLCSLSGSRWLQGDRHDLEEWEFLTSVSLLQRHLLAQNVLGFNFLIQQVKEVLLVLLLLLLLSRFSRVRFCATPETAAHQAPSSLGFSRQEHWSGLPFPSPMHES